MKVSIRTKFAFGMIFLFIIILVLSVFSSVYMTRLSKKTSSILKENYLSLFYARNMSDGIMSINQEITTSFLIKKNSDKTFIESELRLIESSLKLEKNNITEPGEDKLVKDIESNYNEYRDSVMVFVNSSHSVSNVLFLQNQSGIIYKQLAVLSQMNGTAIEVKTDDAKISAKNASTQMTIFGTLSFLIAVSFIFSFTTYFNDRFFQLFNGIKEIASNNYNQRLFFDGNDEFYEISIVFNEMAEILNRNKQKLSVTLPEDLGKDETSKDIQELRKALLQMKNLEEKTVELISRLEKK